MKLDFKKFKKVASDNKATTMKHDDGHSITIAHAPLASDTLKKLKALPMYNEGGKVQKDTPPEPNAKKAKEMEKGATSPGTSVSEGIDRIKKQFGYAEGGEVSPSDEKNIPEPTNAYNPEDHIMVPKAMLQQHIQQLQAMDKPMEGPSADPLDFAGPSEIAGIAKAAVPMFGLAKAAGSAVAKEGAELAGKGLLGEFQRTIANLGQKGAAFHERALVEKTAQDAARKAAGKFTAAEANAIPQGVQKGTEVAEKVASRVKRPGFADGGEAIDITDMGVAPPAEYMQERATAPVDPGPTPYVPPGEYQVPYNPISGQSTGAPSLGKEINPEPVSQEPIIDHAPPAASRAPAQAAPSSGGVPDSAGLVSSGYQQELRGEKARAEAEAKQGDVETAVHEKAADDIRKQIQNVQDTTNEGLQERALFIKNIKDGHIQPEKYWEDHSKLQAGIGLMLGGLGGPEGSESVMRLINNNIDRNIAAQQANLNSDHNLLAANLHTYGNMRDAQAMTRVMYNDMAVNALQQAASMSRGAQAKAIAEINIGKLKRQVAPEFMQFAMRQALIKAGQSGGGQGDQTEAMLPYLRVLNPAAAKEIEARHIPGVGTAQIPVPEKPREEIQARQSLQDQVRDLRAWASKHSGSLNPADIAYGKAKAAQVQDQYRRANGQGVFREAEADFVKGIVADDPTAFFNKVRVDPKYKALEDGNMMTLNSLKKSYGLPQASAQPQLTPQQASFAQHAQKILQNNPNDAKALMVLKKLGIQ